MSLAGAAALLVLMICGVAYFTLRELGSYARLARRRAEELRVQGSQEASETARQQLDAAINNMPQGLVMFDSEERLVVCNKRYMDMYALPAEIAAPGRKLRDIVAYRIEQRGLRADADRLAAKV